MCIYTCPMSLHIRAGELIIPQNTSSIYSTTHNTSTNNNRLSLNLLYVLNDHHHHHQKIRSRRRSLTRHAPRTALGVKHHHSIDVFVRVALRRDESCLLDSRPERTPILLSLSEQRRRRTAGRGVLLQVTSTEN